MRAAQLVEVAGCGVAQALFLRLCFRKALFLGEAFNGFRKVVLALPPREIGLMFVATASSQALATQIARTCNPIFFHFGTAAKKEMPSYGFPFSPAEMERGETYSFHLNHVVATVDPFELVRTEWLEVG